MEPEGIMVYIARPVTLTLHTIESLKFSPSAELLEELDCLTKKAGAENSLLGQAPAVKSGAVFLPSPRTFHSQAHLQ